MERFRRPMVKLHAPTMTPTLYFASTCLPPLASFCTQPAPVLLSFILHPTRTSAVIRLVIFTLVITLLIVDGDVDTFVAIIVVRYGSQRKLLI